MSPVTHQIVVSDGSDTQDRPGEPTLMKMKKYQVLNPIFKNGKKYAKGRTVELEENTGQRFVEAGDLKEKK